MEDTISETGGKNSTQISNNVKVMLESICRKRTGGGFGLGLRLGRQLVQWHRHESVVWPWDFESEKVMKHIHRDKSNNLAPVSIEEARKVAMHFYEYKNSQFAFLSTEDEKTMELSDGVELASSPQQGEVLL